MKRNFILIAVMVFSSLVAHAQKMGYVNLQEIYVQLPEIKQANSDLDVMKEMFKKKGEEMVRQLQIKYQEFQQKQAKGELSPIEAEKQANDLKAEEQKIMEFDQTSQKTMVSKSEELLAPIHEKVEKAIKDVAAENQFLYIFDSSQGLVLYADSTANVTSLVKAKLGIKE